jgi:LmbE family N-acetylglucosaminyl deacetylase
MRTTPRPDGAPDLGTVLSVWAHPDDETYLAAGHMAAARDAGCRVVCVSASAGELGTSDPQRWPPERLATVRRWEAAAAMAVLGVHEHHVGTFPDGSLTEHEAAGVRWAGRWLDEVRPDTILTFGADGITFHPDHVAVHRWVTAAWEQRSRPCRLLYAATTVEHLTRFGELYEAAGTYMTDERPTGVGEADLASFVRLQGDGLDRKLTALRAMATQTAELIARIDPDLYAAEVAEEAFVDAEPMLLRSNVVRSCQDRRTSRSACASASAGGATASQASTTASRSARSDTADSWISTAA